MSGDSDLPKKYQFMGTCAFVYGAIRSIMLVLKFGLLCCTCRTGLAFQCFWISPWSSSLVKDLAVLILKFIVERVDRVASQHTCTLAICSSLACDCC